MFIGWPDSGRAGGRRSAAWVIIVPLTGVRHFRIEGRRKRAGAVFAPTAKHLRSMIGSGTVSCRMPFDFHVDGVKPPWQ
jgi:hypothetical protein